MPLKGTPLLPSGTTRLTREYIEHCRIIRAGDPAGSREPKNRYINQLQGHWKARGPGWGRILMPTWQGD